MGLHRFVDMAKAAIVLMLQHSLADFRRVSRDSFPEPISRSAYALSPAFLSLGQQTIEPSRGEAMVVAGSASIEQRRIQSECQPKE